MIVSKINNINYKSQNFTGDIPVTQRHIDAISGVNADTIAFLDSLGLINKSMLSKVKDKSATLNKIESEKSLNAIAKIIADPHFSFEIKDNGYYAEAENRYDYRLKDLYYVQGDKSYYSPVFMQEQEFNSNLRKLTEIPSEKNLKSLIELIKSTSYFGKFMIKNLKVATDNKPLSKCIYKNEHELGIVKPMTHGEYINDTFFVPLYETIEKIGQRL